jgi:hypothetical protein
MLKTSVYIYFNIWEGVLITQHVCAFMLLWRGRVTIYLNKLSQMFIMPAQYFICETGYEFLNISNMNPRLYQLHLDKNRRTN